VSDHVEHHINDIYVETKKANDQHRPEYTQQAYAVLLIDSWFRAKGTLRGLPDWFEEHVKQAKATYPWRFG
jgi:hypothetical protein